MSKFVLSKNPTNPNRLHRGTLDVCLDSETVFRDVATQIVACYARWALHVLCLGGVFDSGDEGEVSVAAGGVEAVAYYEVVGDDEAAVVDLYFFFDARLGFIEEGGELDGAGAAGAEDLEEAGECMAGVDNVFDDDHVLAADRIAEVFEDLDIAGGLCAVFIARDGHEIDRESQVDGPDKVGEKDARALQNADQHEIAILEFGGDLGAELFDAVSDLIFVDEDLEILIGKLRGLSL